MAVLAEFELRVLLSVLRAGDEAYAVAVHETLERRTGRRASLGAVYITLDRLERKGLLASRLGEPTAERGGRAKRYYRATRAGTAAAREESRVLRRLLDGLDVLTDKR
ncbi:MAG TPA: helix-turn-helix transcriptional regulator [Vicinamibacterales bacterium]|nr:helix-turn-helix transcriptional regulator [Vicinamibacterales bacterium]